MSEANCQKITAERVSGQDREPVRGERFVMSTNRIEINPNVMLGKPVVKGTRIPVEIVLLRFPAGARSRMVEEAV